MIIMKKPKTPKQEPQLKATDEAASKRYLIIEFLCSQNGLPDKERLSLRKIAAKFECSHTKVAKLRDKYLVKRTYTRGGVPYTEYTKIEGIKEKIGSKRRGPVPGTKRPVFDQNKEIILKTKEKYPKLGAAKIAIIAQATCSHVTAHRILKENGHENVTMHLPPKKYKSFVMPHSNDMWQIDYVEIGHTPANLGGKKVQFLSIIDDHSRMILSWEVRENTTTDDVLTLLETTIEKFQKPKRILSDHGTQWASASSGKTRFDEWCEDRGIVHVMGQVRKPTTQGKVERWHGSLRREMELPETGTYEEYGNLMKDYVFFYNRERPHWAIDQDTPERAYCRDWGDLRCPESIFC